MPNRLSLSARSLAGWRADLDGELPGEDDCVISPDERTLWHAPATPAGEFPLPGSLQAEFNVFPINSPDPAGL